MNNNTKQKIEIKASTREVFFDYSEQPDHKTDSRFFRIASWFSKQINAHFDRLSALQVYDNSRMMNKSKRT